jgi:Tfp pilus assembly protein PilF
LLGVAYGRKGLSELAHKSLEAAIKLDKKNAQIRNNLGYLLISEGDYKGAADQLNKAARLAPDDARILNNLALAQAQLGKFDDSYQNFVRAGGEVNARINIANLLELAGRSDEALKQYDAARLTAEADQKKAGDQSIEVLMEIRNGWVTFASIVHPRPGFAAYEASALRIARRRRYAAGKNGQETMVVKITPFPNS